MSEKEYIEIIKALTEKITRLESDAFVKDYDNEKLKEENARLNELLTPKAKVGADNE